MSVFPSTEWLERLAQLAMHDDAYRRFGRVDALVGLKVGDRVFRLTFDVFEIRDIREITADELRDLDFYLDLTLPDGLHQNATGDGYRADKFFRFNESLQRFLDLSAHVS